MGDSHKSGWAVILAAFLAVSGILEGCAGPSTRVLPRETREQPVQVEELPILEEGNPFYLREELEILADSPRPAGSEGEKRAVRYIRQLLEDYGYEVSLQGYTYREDGGDEKISGTNVIAIRPAPSPHGDILIVGACHDTAKNSPGAVATASGVAALLETARLLSHMPTDTELRFISFSSHEDSQAGARYYVSSLAEEERHRVVGTIMLGSLGFSVDSSVVMATEDGEPTLLGDTIYEASRELLRESWSYEQREEEEHSRFVQGRIPAVTVTQEREAFEAGTPFDRPDLVDLERLTETVNVISRAISEIASPDTPSMLAKSRHYNDLRENSYVQHPDVLIPFGETVFQTEKRLGANGHLISQNTDNEGNPIEVYRYYVKWLNVDQTLITDYYYTGKKLTLVRVDADGAGVDFTDMEERLTDVYGEPEKEPEGPAGSELIWQVSLCPMRIVLSPGSQGYTLEFQEGVRIYKDIDRYEVTEGTESNPQLNVGARIFTESEEQDFRVHVLINQIRQLLPLKGSFRVTEVRLYTDGLGETTALLETDSSQGEEGNAPAFVWSVDLEDAVLLDGEWRNETETIRQILLLYGQMLEQTEPYRSAFEEVFGEKEGEESVLLGLEPGEMTKQLPDMKESFLWFVLVDPPDVEGEWGERIRFFYQYEELTAYRNRIRNNLMLK